MRIVTYCFKAAPALRPIQPHTTNLIPPTVLLPLLRFISPDLLFTLETPDSMGRANDTKRSSSTVYSDGADHGASSFSSTIPLLNQVPVEDDDPPAYTDVIPEGHVRRNDLETNEIRCGKTQKNGRGSTRTVLSRSITSNPELLQDFVAAEARLMPNPLVRMMGTHTETRFRDKREETNTVTDFDITLSAADLLALPWRRTRIIENGVKAYRGTRTRSIGSSFKADVETTRPTPSLQEWCHRFCASSASLKTYG